MSEGQAGGGAPPRDSMFESVLGLLGMIVGGLAYFLGGLGWGWALGIAFGTYFVLMLMALLVVPSRTTTPQFVSSALVLTAVIDAIALHALLTGQAWLSTNDWVRFGVPIAAALLTVCALVRIGLRMCASRGLIDRSYWA